MEDARRLGFAMTKIAFVCVENAFRSQIAAAFARRFGGKDLVVLSGGTRPAAKVHEDAVALMRERGIDLSRETPRAITPAELADCDYVITMGCSADDVCPADFTGKARDWALPDPKGKGLPFGRHVRDEIERRVRELLKEIRHESGGRQGR